MATFKPVVFTTKNHIKTDGTTNIKIRIYHNKDSQYSWRQRTKNRPGYPGRQLPRIVKCNN